MTRCAFSYFDAACPWTKEQHADGKAGHEFTPQRPGLFAMIQAWFARLGQALARNPKSDTPIDWTKEK